MSLLLTSLHWARAWRLPAKRMQGSRPQAHIGSVLCLPPRPAQLRSPLGWSQGDETTLPIDKAQRLGVRTHTPLSAALHRPGYGGRVLATQCGHLYSPASSRKGPRGSPRSRQALPLMTCHSPAWGAHGHLPVHELAILRAGVTVIHSGRNTSAHRRRFARRGVGGHRDEGPVPLPLPRGPSAGQRLLCDVLLPRWDRPFLCGSSHLGLPEEPPEKRGEGASPERTRSLRTQHLWKGGPGAPSCPQQGPAA